MATASSGGGVKKPIELDKSRIVGFGNDPDPNDEPVDEWDEMSTSVIAAVSSGLDNVKSTMGGAVEKTSDVIADSMDTLGGWINTSFWQNDRTSSSPTNKNSDEKELVVLDEDAEEAGARGGEKKDKDVSAGSAAEIIQELCTIRSTRVIPTVSQLDYFCDRISGLRMQDVVQEISSRLSYSAGETQWQPRLRILYGMKALHENGMGVQFTKLLKEVEHLVTTLLQLPECSEMAQEVLDLKNVPASEPLTEVEAIKRRRQRRRQQGSKACDTALMSFDDDDSGVGAIPSVSSTNNGQQKSSAIINAAQSSTNRPPQIDDPFRRTMDGTRNPDTEMMEELLGMSPKKTTTTPSITESSLLDSATGADGMSREVVQNASSSAGSTLHYPSGGTYIPQSTHYARETTSGTPLTSALGSSSFQPFSSTTNDSSCTANKLRNLRSPSHVQKNFDMKSTGALERSSGVMRSNYPEFPPPPAGRANPSTSTSLAVSQSAPFVDQFPPMSSLSPFVDHTRAGGGGGGGAGNFGSGGNDMNSSFVSSSGSGGGGSAGKDEFRNATLNFTGLGPADYSPSIDLQKRFSPLAASSLAYSSPMDLCNKSDTHFEFVNELFDKSKSTLNSLNSTGGGNTSSVQK